MKTPRTKAPGRTRTTDRPRGTVSSTWPVGHPRRRACATSLGRTSPLSSAPRRFSPASALRTPGVRSAVGCGTPAAVAWR
eukprot:1310346-Alexandrium_andersonii.AAC.1